jgi:uncharacterized protein YjbI with pentapeptide repeats
MEITSNKHDFNLQLSENTFENQEFFRKFLVSQKIEGKRFYKTFFEMLNIHDCTLKGIQWVDCEIKTSEITQSYFHYNYFRNCTFINTQFHDTQFLNCVFDNCNFNQELASLISKETSNLVFAKEPVAAITTQPAKEVPAVATAATAKAPQNVRFEALEV